MKPVENSDIAKLIVRLTCGALLFMHGSHSAVHGIDHIKSSVTANGLPEFIAYGNLIGEVVAPIFLENDDIKERDSDDLLFQEKLLACSQSNSLTVKGLPYHSKDIIPLVLLVPHLRAQVGNFSVSMLNVANVI